MECRPGWSDWMNNDQPIPDKKDSDIEPLPSPKDFKDVIGVKKTKTKVKGVSAQTHHCYDNIINCLSMIDLIHEETHKNILQIVTECSVSYEITLINAAFKVSHYIDLD